MPRDKKTVELRSARGTHTIEGQTIESALRELAKQAKKGELEFPCTVTFDGPSGLKFNITVDNAEAAGEMQTMGFMF